MHINSLLLTEKDPSERSKKIGQECAKKAMHEFEKEILTPKKRKNFNKSNKQ